MKVKLQTKLQEVLDETWKERGRGLPREITR